MNTPDALYKTLGPDRFWSEVNKPFIDAAISRGDDIFLATKPTSSVLLNPKSSDGLSGFGREIEYLKEHGYKYDAATGKMCKGGC